MTGTSRSDAELILDSWDRPEAFEALFDRHHDPIYRYLTARVGPDDAEDLAAEVFVRAFEGRRRYNPEISSARPWLYGIASNLAKQRARSLRYQAEKLSRLRHTQDRLTTDDLDDLAARTDAAALWPQVAAALDELSTVEREVVALHLIAGLNQAETGQALGIPEGTVKSRFSRARHKLGELLTGLRESRGRESEGSGQGDRNG